MQDTITSISVGGLTLFSIFLFIALRRALKTGKIFVWDAFRTVSRQKNPVTFWVEFTLGVIGVLLFLTAIVATLLS